MKLKQVVAIVLLAVCSVLLYSKTKQVYRLRKENELLKQTIEDCKSNYRVSSQYLDMYDRAFAIIDRRHPEVTAPFDLLVNGIDPWQDKEDTNQ